MVAKAVMSSGKADWCTPANVLDLVRKVAPIGLDPCSNPRSIVGARKSYSIEAGDNGLRLPWNVNPDELVFVNPPYGNKLGRWLGACHGVGRARVAEVIALVPARVDTDWWQEHCPAGVESDAVAFWRGRIEFEGGDGVAAGAPFPSCLVYWGERAELFAHVFSSPRASDGHPTCSLWVGHPSRVSVDVCRVCESHPLKIESCVACGGTGMRPASPRTVQTPTGSMSVVGSTPIVTRTEWPPRGVDVEPSA